MVLMSNDDNHYINDNNILAIVLLHRVRDNEEDKISDGEDKTKKTILRYESSTLIL